MNNSELSVEVPSGDAFMARPTYVYPSSWESSPSEDGQDRPSDHNGCYSDGVVEVECTKGSGSHDVRRTQAVEVCWCPEVEQADLGLWLLSSYVTRHNRWERLRETGPAKARARKARSKYSANLVKRSCDIVGSLFLLIVLLPLLVLIAILIKLDSPGPVFFRHHRVGEGGKHFVLWKFRSMRTDVPKYEVSPRDAVDGRLTRIGRLIRRMSIDEIPQLINVLKGEMSIVGPRPEMPFIVARYGPAEYERLVARPGITGLWQISHARAFPIHENLQYDLHYIRNQNFFLDCAIILRTITAVIHGIGAV
jgi:lipopolysaccharide/colanic/teichoic acid biosynthesis glycosyltransferase